MMAWLLLIWAVGLKYTEGFTRLYPSLLTLSAMLISFLLLAQSLKTLLIGTAYAVWTVVYGLYFLGEPATLWLLLA